VLDGVRDGVVTAWKRFDSETKTTIDGYPGARVPGEKTVDGDEQIFAWHIYLVGPRLYQVAAVAKKSDSTSPEITSSSTHSA